MKSIEKRFNKASKEYQYLSSYMCFTEAIKGQKFSKKMINIWFNKLVEKDDYSKKDKKELLRHLYLISNRPEEGEKWEKNPTQSLLNGGLSNISNIKIINFKKANFNEKRINKF